MFKFQSNVLMRKRVQTFEGDILTSAQILQ